MAEGSTPFILAEGGDLHAPGQCRAASQSPRRPFRRVGMDETRRCPMCFEQIDARAVRCSHCGQRQAEAPGLHRDVPGRLVGGVCAALAHHFSWDVTVMRVALVAISFVSGGVGFWMYVMLWLLTPYEAGGRAPAMRAADWIGRLFSPPAPSDQPPRAHERL